MATICSQLLSFYLVWSVHLNLWPLSHPHLLCGCRIPGFLVPKSMLDSTETSRNTRTLKTAVRELVPPQRSLLPLLGFLIFPVQPLRNPSPQIDVTPC